MKSVRYRRNVLAATFALLVWAAPAAAHHGFAAEFDINNPITVKGAVTKIDWINPHVYIYFSAKDSAGKPEEWVFTSWPTNMLRRSGVTRDTLLVGETLTILAYRARDGSKHAFTRRLIFNDGHEVELWCPSTIVLAPFR